MKFLFMSLAMLVVAGLGFTGGAIDTTAPGWLTFQQAEASPYRRSVRRTSRRTSRRVSRRHSGYYRAPYIGGAAVVAGAAIVTAVAVGTVVRTLPPACRTVIVDGISYHNCEGTYYAPQGKQYIVVDDPGY